MSDVSFPGKDPVIDVVAIDDSSRRLIVDVRGPADSLHAVRVLLVADVLRRMVEDVEGVHVRLELVEDRVWATEWMATVRGMGIREPSTSPAPSESAPVIGRDSVKVALQREPVVGTAPPVLRAVRVGGVTISGHHGRTLADVLGDHDPLALRLALLRFPCSTPATLSTARLHRAQETLDRWQFKVAYWAEMPPAPAVAELCDAIRAGLLIDLDTGAALTLLHRLETDLHVPAGRKFATFVAADRVLGLDLCHLVGKLRR